MSSTKENVHSKRPPTNALRVDAWRDLPDERTPATYRITTETGASKTITLAKGNRVIIDALLQRPLYCASPVRTSDRVCILRHEYGAPITKEMYENDTATDRARFGVYFIGEGVERIASKEEC